LLRYISDTETDGLLDTVTKIHCAVLINIDTGDIRGFRPDEIDEYISEVERADEVWFHNGIKFDEKVILKLYPNTKLPKCYDTMVLSRLVHPDIKSTDFIRAKNWRDYLQYQSAVVEWEESMDETGRRFGPKPIWSDPVPPPFPTKFIGRYSLAAWGYRLGEYKGDFDGGDWQTFSEEMFDYMIQDGVVTLELFKKLMAHEPSPQSVELEHRIARLCAKIEDNGFPFDEKEATKLLGGWVDERESLRRSLTTLFPNWKVRLPDFIPKRDNRSLGYVAGVPVQRWRDMEFNPASRTHIADRLKAKYGWKPVQFTDKGTEIVDDEVLSALPYPEAKALSRYFLLEKRIGQLAEGGQAWLNVCKNGKIHARYEPNGTVTGRSTHSTPNISQVPSVSSEYGRDCRALFHVPKGWIQLGADQQGLELRCLASDLSGLAGDGGNYARIVTEGDVHTTNQLAAGLPSRPSAKTFIYAFLYGAGDAKIGSIAGKGAGAGKVLKQTFMDRTPGLASLIKIVKTAAKRGFIKGIDGRKIPIRSEHSALNMRLQNAGAVVCKQWGVDADDKLKALGLKHGWDGDYVFLSWSHDEYQLAVKDQQYSQEETLADVVERVLIETGRNAGKPFNFQCPLDVEVKRGANWAECH